MSGRGWDVLPDVWEWSRGPLGCLGALPDVREKSGCPPRCLGVVRRPSGMAGRPSRMSGSGRDVILDVREWSGGPLGWPGDPPGCPRVVESGREAHLDVREWLGVVGRPS